MTTWIVGAALVLVVSVASLMTPPVSAQDAPPDAGPTDAGNPAVPAETSPTEPGGPLSFLPDPKQWAADVFNQVLIDLLRGISDALRGALNGVLGSSLNFITQTPPAGSYASPTVRTLWEVVRAIASAGLAVVALWAGMSLIVHQHTGSAYHDAMEIFPRLALGALLANTSLAWGQLAIDLNNALCQAVGQVSLPGWERADGAPQLLVEVLAVLIYLVASLLLLLQMLMRLALVDVFLVISPLGLLCWILPQTQSWARLWSTTFFGAVFTQFVQVLALKLGGALLTEATPMAGDARLLAIFLGVAVLVLTLKIPDLLRNHIDSGLGFARYVVYRQGARALEGRTGGRGGGG